MFLSGHIDRSDPKGLLCCVDYFALRCGDLNWLLDFASGFRTDGQLLSLPGFAYSTALARLGGGRPGVVVGGGNGGGGGETETSTASKGGSKGGSKGKGGSGKGAKGEASGTKQQQQQGMSEEEKLETEDALLGALLTHPAALTAVLDRLESSAVTSDPRWVQALTHPHFAHARAGVCVCHSHSRVLWVDGIFTRQLPRLQHRSPLCG
jgi:hypothetical protein